MIRNHQILVILCLSLLIIVACRENTPEANQSISNELPVTQEYPLYKMDNLVAWCIVPFDSIKRGPSERAMMLKELGFKKFAYDWREEHLPSFPEEVEALRQSSVALTSVWWWIDGQGKELLNPANQQLLNYLDSLDIRCDIWMSFDNRFFEGLDDVQKLEKAVAAVKELHGKVSSIGCRLMLYNHGAWFGDPRNQINIIQESGFSDVGIVYNFHHAHQQIEAFPELLEAMLPYLNTVNINGMNQDGPKILTVSQGESEKEMLKTLALSGYSGHIGIIGHLEHEDVRIVLERNLKGLEEVVADL